MRHETVEAGMLITVEGGEGAGKSTQVSILVDRLKRAGRHPVATREPGGSPAAEEILVCGGGVHNGALMRRLGELLAPRVVLSTSRHGIDPDFLEATAFAWLARQRLLGLPGNLPAVTGARGPRVLGAIYSAPAPDSPNRILSGAS